MIRHLTQNSISPEKAEKSWGSTQGQSSTKDGTRGRGKNLGTNSAHGMFCSHAYGIEKVKKRNFLSTYLIDFDFLSFSSRENRRTESRGRSVPISQLDITAERTGFLGLKS